MKRILIGILGSVCVILLAACSAHTPDNEAGQWDCSVSCAKESSADSYVITYSDQEVVSTAGVLSFQNRNDFDIVVHLLAPGQKETTVEIAAGGAGILYQIDRALTYTVGCHADVAENTEISLIVYDGKWSNIY